MQTSGNDHDSSKNHFITMAQRMARSENNHNVEHKRLASLASKLGDGKGDLLPSYSNKNAGKHRAPPFSSTTLLSKNGFRYLRNMYKNKLEGNLLQDDPIDSVKDLDKVICLYKEWADVVCPKYVFSDVIDKIERLCKTSSMKSYLMALKKGDDNFDEIQFMASKDADDVASILEKSSKILHKESNNYSNFYDERDDDNHPLPKNDEYDDVDQGDFGFAEDY